MFQKCSREHCIYIGNISELMQKYNFDSLMWVLPNVNSQVKYKFE